jgi:hypothetical protein
VFDDVQRVSPSLTYSPGELRGIRNIAKNNLVDKYTYTRLKNYGVLKAFRGCRAGKAVNSKHNGTLNIHWDIAQSLRICILFA